MIIPSGVTNTLIGALGGLFGASSAQNAQTEMAKQMLRLAERQAQYGRSIAQPGLTAANQAITTQGNLLSSQILPKLGKQSGLIEAARQKAVTDLQRQGQAAQARSGMFWGMAGNQGAARGEQLRIGRGTTEAINATNLSGAQGQEQYRATNLNSALSGVSNLGSMGLNLAQIGMGTANQGTANQLGALQSQSAASTYLPSMVSGLGGTLFNSGLWGMAGQQGTGTTATTPTAQEIIDAINQQRKAGITGLKIGNTPISQIKTLGGIVTGW